MLAALAEREAGVASLEGAAAFGHRPARFCAAALGDAGLARRLQQTTALPGHSGAVNALAWTEGGELLASGGEDCRLRLWRGDGGELLHSVETGHTANILSACFLPGSRGDQMITCSADSQVRHLNVTKGAVRPYLVHHGRVRAVVPLDPHVFLSASEDGTVREFDVRLRPAALHREALAGGDPSVLVDQREERFGAWRRRVGVYSLAVDECRPWLMLTGGADPLLRLYDRRMLPGGGGDGGGAPRPPPWVGCFVPSHVKAARWDAAAGGAGAPPGGPPPAAAGAVNAVAFAAGGSEVLGSYAGDLIYAFDSAQHLRDAASLLHIPPAALRAPARPRSRAARRSAGGEVSAQPPARLSPGRLAAEGGGGTAPGEAPDAGHAAVLLEQAGRLLQRQRRALGGRGMPVAPSVRQLERQRRQQAASRAAGEPPRAESSRPAHWQLHPTSSTLRSPLHEQHRAGAPHAPGSSQRAHARAHSHPGQQQQQHEWASDSEGASEEVSPEQRQQGVRRSRRIMRRRRDAAEAAELQQLAEDAAAEAAAGSEEEPGGQPAAGAAQPAVSGVAEPAGSSGSEDPGALSPATRSRRVRRRSMAGAAADAAAVAAAGAHHQGSAEAPGGEHASGSLAAAGGSAERGAEAGGGGFKAPAGRSPAQQRRRQGAAAAAAAAVQRLDSTLGLLHHHTPQLEASEVAAGGGGWGGGAPAAQQEATVSMRGLAPHAGAAGAGDGAAPSPAAAMEVSSRPVPSASQAGPATQLGSQQAGHEASSLNSAEQPAAERVGSVAQRRRRADAPSVGNAPAAAAAATAAAEARRAAAEASTGHNRAPPPPPPPQFAVEALLFQQPLPPGALLQQQQQLLLLPPGPRQRPQLQPTASTGTSRPPAFGTAAQQGQPQQRHLPPQASGRQASRLRRHSAGADASQLGDQAATAALPAAAGFAAVGSQAAPVLAAATEPAAAAAAAQQQQLPQQTMLSGRGPSVLGDFMPGQDQPTGSETQQRQASVAPGGGSGGAGGSGGTAAARRRGLDSAVGAIVHHTDRDLGEEVSEPTLFARCFAGHLNAPWQADGAAGALLSCPLALLGRRPELLVSPSSCGRLFVWECATGRLVAALAPPVPAASADGSVHGGTGGGGGGGALAPVAAVAPHPLLPVLASAGLDSTVRLWSPEAERQQGAEAAVAARANLEALAAEGWEYPPSLLAGGGERRAPAGPGGPSHCHTM